MGKLHQAQWLNYLIVLSSLFILGLLVLIYWWPQSRLAQARNAQRWTTVQKLLVVTVGYWQNNQQQLPVGITPVARLLGTAANCQVACGSAGQTMTNCLDLKGILESEFLTTPLIDPATSQWSEERTGYAINFIDGRLKVFACGAELGEEISISRQLIE